MILQFVPPTEEDIACQSLLAGRVSIMVLLALSAPSQSEVSNSIPESKFLTIPIELRLEIYRRVFGCVIVTIERRYKERTEQNTRTWWQCTWQYIIGAGSGNRISHPGLEPLYNFARYESLQEALNVLLSCKQMYTEAFPVLAGCLELGLACAKIEEIPRTVRDKYFPLIKRIQTVACGEDGPDVSMFPRLEELEINKHETFGMLPRHATVLPTLMIFTNDIIRTELTQILEGGADEALKTTAKEGLIGTGSWLERLLDDSNCSCRIIANLSGAYIDEISDLESPIFEAFMYLKYDLHTKATLERTVKIRAENIIRYKWWLGRWTAVGQSTSDDGAHQYEQVEWNRWNEDSILQHQSVLKEVSINRYAGRTEWVRVGRRHHS
jgi:hypothetical protein